MPPRQVEPFIKKFDKLLKHAFEKLVGTTIAEKWWRIAKLPAKYGGMRLRTGLSTLGAQYTVNVIKNAENIARLLPTGAWSASDVITQDSKPWLDKKWKKDVDVSKIITQLQQPLDEADPLELEHHEPPEKTLSLAQLCELREQQEVYELMNEAEKVRIEAHHGDHPWTTVLPLKYAKFALEPEHWVS